MQDFTNINARQGSQAKFDEGLRDYILRVYNIMFLGLLITGIAAVGTLTFEPIKYLMYQVGPGGSIKGLSGFGMFISFAPLIFVFAFGFGKSQVKYETALTLFWVFCGIMGMSLSSLGIVYTGVSIAKAFFAASSIFAGMSIYGYTTKTDLTAYRSYFIMALIGLLFALILNIFLASSMFDFLISAFGVVLFTALTAYDTQMLKAYYYQFGGGEEGKKMAISGAFALYMDFINLFIYLLRFMGDRK